MITAHFTYFCVTKFEGITNTKNVFYIYLLPEPSTEPGTNDWCARVFVCARAVWLSDAFKAVHI